MDFVLLEGQYMSIKPERKQELIKEFRHHETDCGSTQLQIAVLTERIKNLTEHLKKNPKDFSSRRGLLKLVGHRSALLRYLKRNSFSDYKQLIARLGIRK